jgi:hypothetical protein
MVASNRANFGREGRQVLDMAEFRFNYCLHDPSELDSQHQRRANGERLVLLGLKSGFLLISALLRADLEPVVEDGEDESAYRVGLWEAWRGALQQPHLQISN